jgi:hypothetical protein
MKFTRTITITKVERRIVRLAAAPGVPNRSADTPEDAASAMAAALPPPRAPHPPAITESVGPEHSEPEEPIA